MPAVSANPNKRQRTTEATIREKQKPQNATHSKIFSPFRALGHVTSASTPFTLVPLGTQTYQLTTSVGYTFQTFDIRKLNLVFVSSPATPKLIQKLFAYRDVVYVAFEGGVWIFKRGKKIAELEAPMGGWSGKNEWRELLVLGDWIVGAFASGEVLVWRSDTKEFYTEFKSPVVSGKDAEVRGIVHPPTYLNKVVVARGNGVLEVWNIKRAKLIYNTSLSPSTSGYSTIVSITNTPALHTLAVAFSSGDIFLHNILLDETLFVLNQESSSAKTKRLTSITFCTDPNVGAGLSGGAKDVGDGAGKILAAANTDGDVVMWDLEKQRVVGVLRNAHMGAITRAEFLNGQNLLVTAGADNSVKEWIFDSPHNPLPRLLRMRGGHSAPPTTLTFYDPDESHFMLSSSQDQSLWGVSLRNDAQNFEFSQGAGSGVTARDKGKMMQKRAGPITALAVVSDTGLSKDWDGILTAHRGEMAARSWSFRNKKIGKWVFETPDKSEVKAVAISACGNFGLVGSALGAIEMFNLQSGRKRRVFPEFTGVGKKTKQLPGKHTKAVTSILTDDVNRTIISTGLDGKVKFWDFNSGVLLHELDWSATTSITGGRIYRANDLIALACDDLSIRVVDIGTKKTVRELWGCSGRITDFCFSPSGRWLLASSLDGALRIWDLPTGHLIDGFRTQQIITAIAFSGTGEYLATAHVGDVGINLWTNRTMFRATAPTKAISENDIVMITGPKSSGEGGISVIEMATAQEEEEESASTYTTVEQLSKELMTLSMQPQHKWQTLVHLDIIKERSKPTEAPKKPEKAPFFLSLLSSTGSKPAAAEQDTRILTKSINSSSSITPHLSSSTTLIPFLHTLSPAQTSFHIHSLSPSPPYEELISFIRAITERVREKRDWEMCLAWMRVFLKAWKDVVVECVDGEGGEGSEELLAALREWREVCRKEGERLGDLGGWCMGVVGFLRGV